MQEGVRKYRAFLFSLICLTMIAALGQLTALYVEGLAWILGLFSVSNVGVHAARAFGKQGEVESERVPVAREKATTPG